MTKGAKLEESVGSLHPELLKDFNNEINPNINLFKLKPGSNVVVNWKCNTCKHDWATRIIHRTKGTGCPKCSNKKREKVVTKSNLQVERPDIAGLWNLKKNHPHRPEDFTVGSNFKAVFTCINGHDSATSIYHKVNGRECPYCTGQKVGYGNSLGDMFKVTASYWHPTKNQGLTPFDVTSKSYKKVWWIIDGVEREQRVCTVSEKYNI